MRLLLALLFAVPAVLLTGCANDNYDDPTYRLQHNLYDRNQRWDQRQNHNFLRRQAQDNRYQAWFNSVME